MILLIGEKMVCEHELKLLSGPTPSSRHGFFNDYAFYLSPIFQCVKCLKVFKISENEQSLVEIPILELTEEDKKKMFMEHDKK